MLRTTLCILLLTALLPVAVDANGRNGRSGYAAHYRVGLMERVARNRNMPQSRCMVATSYYPLGAWLSVTSNVTDKTLRCRVTDVTAKAHIREVRRRGIIIEFGAANILEMCNLRRVGEAPPRECPVTVRLAQQ